MPFLIITRTKTAKIRIVGEGKDGSEQQQIAFLTERHPDKTFSVIYTREFHMLLKGTDEWSLYGAEWRKTNLTAMEEAVGYGLRAADIPYPVKRTVR